MTQQTPPASGAETLLTRPASGWAKLHTWGNSKVVQSSVIWVLVLPPITKTLLWLYSQVGIVLIIPLNIILLYFGALAFAAASVLFKFFAPEIVQKAPSYSAFMLNQHSHLELKNWYHDLSCHTIEGQRVIDPERIKEFLRILRGSDNMTGAQLVEVIQKRAGPELLNPFWWERPVEGSLPFLHEITLKAADGVRPGVRLTTSVLYWIGFAAVSWVAITNLVAVARYLLLLP